MAKVVANTAIYATPDGREIEVCQVTETPEQHTQWPDIVYLGEVTCRIRTERVNPKSLWLMHPPYDRR